MKTLPKYFAIKRINNPLWWEYIKWINEIYGTEFSGVLYEYYGFDGIICDCQDKLEFFSNPVEVITLEQWSECVNGVEKKDEIIGYKLTGKVSAKQAGDFLGCSPSIYPDGSFLKCIPCQYVFIEMAKDAGILNIWFEPMYAESEITYSVGGKLDVTIKERKIYHKNTDITDYVKQIKLYADNIRRKLDKLDSLTDDIILTKKGCESKKTKLSDWLKLYDIWAEKQ